eukprot:CAMPEP_0194033746 /NCGR_PEP_ID=MMETSP0009_2-20130614/6301_1 /TAXON_ID=210454 /ORGANISM="Grammatophora oceanica, Strain CCMP 410" /LENGTH=464 /DNA_ID=CAMNT_0038674465 /DNA_START=90 /DNA_END=1484 /DNA_ORIENTATION=-
MEFQQGQQIATSTEADGEERPEEKLADESLDVPPPPLKNSNISAFFRYGIPLYLVATFCLLLASDLGSGITAEYVLYRSDGSVFEKRTLLTASIFSSVKELWMTESYPLAILIAVTSIAWPYIKIALTMFSWAVPMRTARRREKLLQAVDVCGKWSFVDIFVLVIIMVAFRSTIRVGGNVLEIVIVPLWGFFGFVCATILSLIGTQVVLYHHRQQQYPYVSDGTATTSLSTQTNINRIVVGLWSVLTVVLHIVGVIVNVYEVESVRGVLVRNDAYSIVSVGKDLPTSILESEHSSAGVRFIQVLWFLLAVALPILQCVLWSTLYLGNWSARFRERLFEASEVTFSWCCIEVMIISAIFSVTQIPTFGDGLIESNCDLCFEVSSTILPEFAVIVVSCILNVFGSYVLYRKGHQAIYLSRWTEADPLQAEQPVGDSKEEATPSMEAVGLSMKEPSLPGEVEEGFDA